MRSPPRREWRHEDLRAWWFVTDDDRLDLSARTNRMIRVLRRQRVRPTPSPALWSGPLRRRGSLCGSAGRRSPLAKGQRDHLHIAPP